jgi:hypothetical protein
MSAAAGRWCETHQSWGDHHTDRCPQTYGQKSADEQEWDMVQAQRRIMGHAPKPFPCGRTETKPNRFGRMFRTLVRGTK